MITKQKIEKVLNEFKNSNLESGAARTAIAESIMSLDFVYTASEKECCSMCGEETEYNFDDNIEYRNYYVEGAGQLCPKCFNDMYGDY